jgi:hypothetical protein
MTVRCWLKHLCVSLLLFVQAGVDGRPGLLSPKQQQRWRLARAAAPADAVAFDRFLAVYLVLGARITAVPKSVLDQSGPAMEAGVTIRYLLNQLEAEGGHRYKWGHENDPGERNMDSAVVCRRACVGVA